jgi:CBS domain-containing protein
MLARDFMRTQPRTIGPEATLRDLERELLASRMGGFPVVAGGRLVGIVSRSDVLRRLGVEQVCAEQISEFYHDISGFETEGEPFTTIAEQVGLRLDGVEVKDIMLDVVVTAVPDQTVQQVAALLCDHRIHRVPVVDHGELVGIITTFDLTSLVAQGRLVEA